jgi:tryptophan-rich sensory protein
MKYFLNYIIAGLVVAGTAIGGSRFTDKSVKSTWYDCIKPSITPPSFVFPIVWTTLYIFIAIAFARTIDNFTQTWFIILLFLGNFALNILWCWAYFGAKRIQLSFLLILLLVASIIAIIFSSRDWVVIILLLPYLAWVSFATYLNYRSIEKEKECATQR